MFLELTQSLLHGVLCHISVTPVRGQLVVKMETFRVVPSNKSQGVGSQFLWLDPSKPKMYPAFLVLPILKGKNTVFLYVSHYVCNLRCAELLLSQCHSRFSFLYYKNWKIKSRSTSSRFFRSQHSSFSFYLCN